jgi:hypothetical protein
LTQYALRICDDLPADGNYDDSTTNKLSQDNCQFLREQQGTDGLDPETENYALSACTDLG